VAEGILVQAAAGGDRHLSHVTPPADVVVV
jgi:hypothetical protein